MVVFGHLITFCGIGYDNPMIETIILINMPLFLFLNGIVARKLSITNWGGYLRTKFKQIMIPFFIWGGIITLFRHETYLNFITHYWKFGYWYLLVLFEFYILLCIINILYSKLKNLLSTHLANITLIIMIATGYFATRALGQFIPQNISAIIDYYQFLDYYPYFTIGFLIRQFDITEYLKKYQNIAISSLIIVASVGYLLWNYGYRPEFSVFLVRLSIVLLFLVLFMSFDSEQGQGNILSRCMNNLGFIGRHTLAIYMIQYFFFPYINLSDLYNYLLLTSNSLALVAVTIVCAVAICYLCIAIEKIFDQSWYLRFLIGK